VVTAAQLSRLDAKLDALVAAIDTDSKPITAVIAPQDLPEPEAQSSTDRAT
jgi:hypothetical protein